VSAITKLLFFHSHQYRAPKLRAWVLHCCSTLSTQPPPLNAAVAISDLKSILRVVAQCLGRRSMAGGLSLICALSMVDR